VPTATALDARPDEQLVLRARAGDEVAWDLLLRRHGGLARQRAAAYFLAGGERDDLLQEAMIGLCLAVRDFDPDGGSSFRTFAGLCVSRQVVTAIRAAGRRKHAPLNDYVSLQGPSAAGERALAEVLPAPPSSDPAQAVLHAEQVAGLRDHVRRTLSPLEAQVLGLHVEGVGYREIAAHLHRGPKSIDNTLQRARRKLTGPLQALSHA
jgi:RNA polymerase sporulation-specific sigma factor